MSSVEDTPQDERPGAEEAAPDGRFTHAKRLVQAAAAALVQRLRRKPPSEGEAAEEGAGSEAPPRWRQPLLYGAGALLCLAIGAGLAWFGLPAHFARQTAELDWHKAELERQKGLIAGYDKLLVRERKQFQEEQARRLEAERRLALLEAEALRPGGTRASARAGPPASGSCDLRPGNIGQALRGCLEEFNRQ